MASPSFRPLGAGVSSGVTSGVTCHHSPLARPTGFEVLGEHQPACTSVFLFLGLTDNRSDACLAWCPLSHALPLLARLPLPQNRSPETTDLNLTTHLQNFLTAAASRELAPRFGDRLDRYAAELLAFITRILSPVLVAEVREKISLHPRFRSSIIRNRRLIDCLQMMVKRQGKSE